MGYSARQIESGRMTNSRPDEAPLDLLVAGRDPANGGLFSARRLVEGGWHVEMLDTMLDLAALCAHPSLPLVYGVSGEAGGELVVWSMGAEVASRTATVNAGFETACDVAVSPDGRMLIVTDFGDSSSGGELRLWELTSEGRPLRGGSTVRLAQGGEGDIHADIATPHPHQAIFSDGVVLVPDLGADRIRRFVAASEGLEELPFVRVPSGTGPRHIAVVDTQDSAARVVISGELGETVLLGALNAESPQWSVVPSTCRAGAARTRTDRNHPGDIQGNAARDYFYLANRGHDTILTVRVEGTQISVVNEMQLPIRWPQHLFVTESELFVAGWDSSNVAVAELHGSVPESFSVAFSCPGPAWIIRNPAVRSSSQPLP